MINFIVLTFVFIKFYQKNVFQVLLNVFVCFIYIYIFLLFLFGIFKVSLNSEYITSESVIDFKKLPDVYFIIFDNMANFDVLNEYYNFDTSEINNQLIDNNYYIYENSTSLYGQTRLSMSSILNLDYLFPEGEVPFSTRSQIVQTYLSIDSLVYTTFEKNNYDLFIVGENFPCDME